jgi:nitrite reductase/ring-hydroxylating ferredoxin subunit
MIFCFLVFLNFFLLIGSFQLVTLNKFKSKNLILNDANTNANVESNVELNNIDKPNLFHFGKFPRLDGPNENGQLTWYPIGFAKDFNKKPKRITIRDVNYIVWKNNNDYYGLRDSCSHQGSSFMYGSTCGNYITCPYHGYQFDSDGKLAEIPELNFMETRLHDIDCFKVVEKADMVYLNTVPVLNEDVKNKIDEKYIFVEPEFYDPDQRPVMLSENFEHNAKFVSVNSLDICHIGFVHTFGNKKHPNPVKKSPIIKLADTDNHYKIIYEYIAGENSLVSKVYNINNIFVENEYALPHSTVARVKFADYTSTIITHALPVSRFKTILFVKAYRNYWSFNTRDKYDPLLPFKHVVNNIGDKFTYKTMGTTLKQDKCIVDFIDKSSYEGMHGKFSIIYDMFSNHYKNNYRMFYEEVNML